MIKLKLFFITLLLSAIPTPALSNVIKAETHTAHPSHIAQLTEYSDREALSPTAVEPEPDTNELLREQIRLLEDRQQQLEQEIYLLRQQVELQIDQTEQNAQTEEDPVETAIEETDESPMALGIELTVGTFSPKFSDLQDFAIIDPLTALVAGGELATVDFQDSTAFGYGATYQFKGTPIDIEASRLSAQSSGEATASAPPAGVLLGTLLNPGQNETVLTASARTDFSYSVTDLDVGYRFDLGQSADSRLYGGLRFASIAQDTSVQYDGVDTQNASVDIERDFSGFGLHIGNRTDIELGAGFSLFGQAGGALLLGDVQLNQQEFDNEGLLEIATLDQTGDSRVVPVVDLSAGVSWSSYVSEQVFLDISLGYAIEQWFNVLDTVRYVDSSGAGVLTQESANFSYDGVFLDLGIKYDF